MWLPGGLHYHNVRSSCLSYWTECRRKTCTDGDGGGGCLVDDEEVSFLLWSSPPAIVFPTELLQAPLPLIGCVRLLHCQHVCVRQWQQLLSWCSLDLATVHFGTPSWVFCLTLGTFLFSVICETWFVHGKAIGSHKLGGYNNYVQNPQGDIWE